MSDVQTYSVAIPQDLGQYWAWFLLFGIALLALGVSFLAGALWAQERVQILTAGDLNGSVELGQTRSGVVALQIVEGDKASLLLPTPRRRLGSIPCARRT